MILKSIAQGSIKQLECDSRFISNDSNAVFFAVAGYQDNGAKYISDAIDNGAKYIVLPENLDMQQSIDNDVIVVQSDDVRRDFALASSALYKEQPKMIASVTGTNGKTSTTYFYAQIAAALFGAGGYIGSSGSGIFTSRDCNSDIIIERKNDMDSVFKGIAKNMEANLTTPQANVMHRTLAEMHKADVSVLALECSSHGIDQKRIHGVRYSVAGFTNFSCDHLDYHKSMESYFNAKASLFVQDSVHTAIINGDSAKAEELYDMCIENKKKVLMYGSAENIKNDLCFTSGRNNVLIEYRNESFIIDNALFADFQIYNLLCAIGMILSSTEVTSDVSLQDIAPVVPKLITPPGRMEQVARGVYIDYAHTPDGLMRALKALKTICAGRLLLVFGCGGDRCKQKREEMGKIAEEIADFVIVTDDNPRFENGDNIRAAIMKHIITGVEVANREEAIKYAIAMMSDNDIVLIAGKGNETTQEVRGELIPFSDADCVKKYLL